MIKRQPAFLALFYALFLFSDAAIGKLSNESLQEITLYCGEWADDNELVGDERAIFIENCISDESNFLEQDG